MNIVTDRTHSEIEKNSTIFHKKQKATKITKLSQTAVDGIIDDVTSIVQLTTDILKWEVEETLNNYEWCF